MESSIRYTVHKVGVLGMALPWEYMVWFLMLSSLSRPLFSYPLHPLPAHSFLTTVLATPTAVLPEEVTPPVRAGRVLTHPWGEGTSSCIIQSLRGKVETPQEPSMCTIWGDILNSQRSGPPQPLPFSFRAVLFLIWSVITINLASTWNTVLKNDSASKTRLKTLRAEKGRWLVQSHRIS